MFFFFFENFKVANQHDYTITSEMSCPLERLTKQKEYIIAQNTWKDVCVSVKIILKTLQNQSLNRIK